MTPTSDAAQAFRAELEARLAGRAPPHRRALLVAVLNKHLPDGDAAVLVGGALVELLSAAAYTTGDVDLVGDRRAIGALLEAAGFQREGRHFVHDGHGLVVEVVGPDLRESEAVGAVEFEGLTVPAVTVEDAIVDRLLAAKYWRSQTDWEQAVLLAETHRPRLRRDRLEKAAQANDATDALRELEAVVDAVDAGEE